MSVSWQVGPWAGRWAERLLPVLVDGCRRWALWVVIATAAVTGLLAYYTATHLGLDTSTVNMLDPDLPFRRVEAELDRAFPESRDLIVVIDGETADRAEDAADVLAGRLRGQPRLFSSVSQPGQGPFFAHNGLLYLDTAELSDLIDHLSAAEPFLASTARDPSLRGLFSIFGRAVGEKLDRNIEDILSTSFDRIAANLEALAQGHPHRLSWQEEMLVKSDDLAERRRSFILLQPRLDFTSLQPAQEALDFVRLSASELSLDPAHGVRVRLTGPVALDEEELQSVSQGAGLATLLSFTLVWALLLLGLRSLRLAASLLLTLLVGLTWTAAFATAAVGQMNLISVTFAVLFIGLGVDFGIQFGMRYREELLRSGDHAQALRDAAAGVGGALVLAAATAALSFFAFMPTAYRGLGQLGFIAGVSMFLALAATLIVLPALFTLIPLGLDLRARGRAGLAGFWGSFFGGFRGQHHRRMVMLAAAVIAAGAAATLPQARFDFNPLNLKDPKTESVSTLHDLMASPKTGIYVISILTPSLDAARQLAGRLEQLKVVDKTVTLASYVPDDQDERLRMIDDLNLVLVPVFSPSGQVAPPTVQDEAAAITSLQAKLAGFSPSSPVLRSSAQRLSAALARLQTLPGWPEQVVKEAEHHLLGDLPRTLDKLHQLLQPQRVTLNDIPQDIRKSYLAADGRARVEVYPKENMLDNRALMHFVSEVQTVAPNATGSPVTLVEAGRVVIHACLKAAGLALAAALILLALMLRRPRDVALIALPLLVAALLTVATSVLLNLPFNFANVIALPLLLAIGVAFGIYFVMRRRSGLSVSDLFRSSTPRAVLFSGLTTMASFGTLAISAHPGMASMGLLITLALTYALLCTLVMLPAFMGDRAQEHVDTNEL